MQQYSHESVQQALDRLGLGLTVRLFEETTATSQQAAEQIGCELGQIAKSLLFIVNGQPVIVVASGDQRVDDRKLSTLFNVSRKKVKIATADQCIEITGYGPGSVPPLAHRRDDLTILLDDQLQRFEQLYAAAGAHNAIFPVKCNQLPSITGGHFVDVYRESTPAENTSADAK
jgi:prolyl-tRNA editing enzyme YbaK/EbsC (Cys-tRNA(Pro) deacylase)